MREQTFVWNPPRHNIETVDGRFSAQGRFFLAIFKTITKLQNHTRREIWYDESELKNPELAGLDKKSGHNAEKQGQG